MFPDTGSKRNPDIPAPTPPQTPTRANASLRSTPSGGIQTQSLLSRATPAPNLIRRTLIGGAS